MIYLVLRIEDDKSATAGGMSAPGAPVSSSVVDLDGTVEILSGIAGGITSVASSPVDLNKL